MTKLTSPAVQPLGGVRVVELATLIAGPTIGMLLGDYGAEVVKVEHPQGGDVVRTWGNRKDGVGLYHKVLNRNKRLVTADLHTPVGIEIGRRLVKDADIVIENFRPRTLEKWGLGYDVLKTINSGIVRYESRGSDRLGPTATAPASGLWPRR
jgi:formyl-CoA transferase